VFCLAEVLLVQLVGGLGGIRCGLVDRLLSGIGFLGLLIGIAGVLDIVLERLGVGGDFLLVGQDLLNELFGDFFAVCLWIVELVEQFGDLFLVIGKLAGLVGQRVCLILLVLGHCLGSGRIVYDLVANVFGDLLLLVFPVGIFLGVGFLVCEFGLSVGDVRQRACLACGFDLLGHFGDHVFDGLYGLVDFIFGGPGEFVPFGGAVGEAHL
jgi:hypothetical protein